VQHSWAIAAKFGIDADELHRVLLLHVYSHMSALMGGRDPLSDKRWQGDVG
jgi:hypothetical protein